MRVVGFEGGGGVRVMGSEGIYMVEGVVWFVVWSNSLRTRAPPLHQCCKCIPVT